MVASDNRYRAIGPNHVEYFAPSAVPMSPPHIQTIRPFVSGRRKSDGQRVCPTNQRHYAVAVFAADALRLHQLQCQTPQRQCFSIRCHGRKTFALFAAETSRKRSHANSNVGTAHGRLAGTTASQMWIATPTTSSCGLGNFLRSCLLQSAHVEIEQTQRYSTATPCSSVGPVC
jgi:hypothetical protein